MKALENEFTDMEEYWQIMDEYKKCLNSITEFIEKDNNYYFLSNTKFSSSEKNTF